MTFLGALGTVYGIWGPIWPTGLSVEIGAASNEPMKAAFEITNKSVIFEKSLVELYCGFDDVEYPRNRVLENISVHGMGPTVINSAETDTFKCFYPFDFGGDKPIKARIEVRAKYANFPWSSIQSDHLLGTFSWSSSSSPPRWVKGRLFSAE